MAPKRAASRAGAASKAKRRRDEPDESAPSAALATEAASDEHGEAAEPNMQPAAQTTDRREGMADIARRCAKLDVSSKVMLYARLRVDDGQG